MTEVGRQSSETEDREWTSENARRTTHNVRRKEEVFDGIELR